MPVAQRDFRSAVSQVIIVLLPPLVQAALVFRGIRDWVPVWAEYPDPGYQYLMAGPALILGGQPGLIYHPGTVPQLFIGLVAWLLARIGSWNSLATLVVNDPEALAQACAVVIGASYIAALVFASLRLRNAIGTFATLVFQLFLLWALPATQGFRYQLWPESFVLIFAILTIAITAPSVINNREPLSRTATLWLGLISAAGLSSKVVFLPLVAFCLILVPRKRLFLYVGSLTGALLLVLLPVRSRWSSMMDWFMAVLVRPGRHGQAGPWAPLDSLISGQELVGSYVRFYGFVVILLVLCLVAVCAFAHRKVVVTFRPFVAVLAGILICLALSLKETEIRDLIALLPLLAILGGLLVQLLLAMFVGGLNWTITVLTACSVGIFLALHGVVQSWYFDQSNRERVKGVEGAASPVEGLLTKGYWALGYNVWTPQNAILFGSNDATMLGVELSDDVLNQEIQIKYPQALHLDVWNRAVQGIDNRGKLRVIPCSELQALLQESPVGIVVESKGHIEFDGNQRGLNLWDGTASVSSPSRVGPYWAYEFESLACQGA